VSGRANIARLINYLEPPLLPSRMRVAAPARPGRAICVVPLQCDRSRNTGSAVMPACGRRRHGANPQSICESECPQKRPTPSRLQRRANYPERRDERPSYPRLPPREYARVPIQSGLATDSVINLRAVAEDASLASVINPFITGATTSRSCFSFICILVSRHVAGLEAIRVRRCLSKLIVRDKRLIGMASLFVIR